MRTPLVLALLGACVNESGLSGQKDDPESFDEGDEIEPPVDHETDETDTDTGGSGIPPEETCEDDAITIPAYALAEIADCEAPESTPVWTLSYKWTDNTLGTMLSTVAIGNLTDDNGNGVIDDEDTPDVVATPYGYQVIAYDGASGTRLWTASTSAIEQTTTAIGDLDGDGFPEVVIAGLYGTLALHGEDGSTYWTGAAPDSIKAYCGSVGIADLDADGDPEVYTGRRILNGQTGATVGTGSYGHGSATSGHSPNSIAADIDLDGEQEVIVGNAAYQKNGTALWYNGGQDGFPAVANFDSDAEGEIIVVSQGSARLLDTDGSVIWTTNFSSGGYSGPPAIADFDGDGEPEVAVPVSPGVVLLDTDGSQIWAWAGVSSSYFDGVSAYDLDGDDDWEVLHVGNDGLHIIDGRTGTLLSSLAGAQTYCGQMPVVADLDNDDHVEMAFGTYSSGVFVMEDATDSFVPGFEVWNQHAFSITNVTEEGEIPASPTQNWVAGYNSFRAGPPLGAVFPNRNLKAEIQSVCLDDCDADAIDVTFAVGNDGTEDNDDPFDVEIWGVTDAGTQLLYTTTWTSTVSAGWMEDSVTVTISGIPKPLYDLHITVDGGNDATEDDVEECDETDNEKTWGNYVCMY